MDFHTLLAPAVVAFIGGAFGFIIKSQQVQGLVKEGADRVAAETAHYIALANTSNNIVLKEMVYAAMTYAEVHEKDVLTHFASKADYVIHTVENDPRFAGFGVGLEAIEHTIEAFYIEYFAAIEHDTQNPPTTK
jgi:hypothetical protein